MAGGIYRRIDYFHRCREYLIRIDLGGKCQFHACLEEREIGLRNSYKRFEFVDLGEYQDRLTAVQLTVFIRLGRDDSAERRFDIGIRIEEIQLLFRRVILRRDLVILLLGRRTGLEQLLDTVLLYLQVSERDLSGLILRLIHTHQVCTRCFLITYFAVDMLYLTGDGRRHILGDITL